jgi:hypothetical protein
MKRGEKKTGQKKDSRRSDLDMIVFVCVVAGLLMTVCPLIIWCFRFDTIPDAYFEHGFKFWGKELIATVCVYWLKGKKKREETDENSGAEDADGEDTDALG